MFYWRGEEERKEKMEVTSEEDAQTVLLEGVEGTQYITIHRADGESLGKGIPLFTLNGEILSDGMVVDMINADVAGEYSTTTQYYETDDLLPPVMTEVRNFRFFLIQKRGNIKILL